MRIGRGCERCRHRHIRCTVRTGAQACNACARLNRPCRLDPRFRFRAVRHVYHKSQGTASRFELEWDPGQVWVDVTKPLTFVQEPGEESEWSASAQSEAEDSRQEVRQEAREEVREEVRDESTVPVVPLNNSNGVTPVTPVTSTPVGFSPVTTNSWTGSWDSNQPSSNPSLTCREASLMRLFISKIAPWADICDHRSHFATEVPRRALQVPMVLKALLALTSRHDAIMTGAKDLEASEYHGQCLELLIAALAQPEETYDDHLLITVVILRIYEELENSTDEKYHLLGSNRLVNTMSKSAYSGGLAEAVAWQFLRQAIYSSIVQYQPLSLNLENYQRSTVFHASDDSAYANIIIFLCARVIQLCGDGGDGGGTFDESAWFAVMDSVEGWYRSRPISWVPLRYRDADFDDDRPFPELWMMSPCVVVGLQYYHASCIFLTFDRWQTLSDFELARARRIAEKTIASHLAMVIGLAMSNETVENACFMVCHLLHRYGYCLRHPAEQRGSLRFLAHVEKNIGWRTEWMVQELEEQWKELRELD